MIDSILEESAKFATNVIAPLTVGGDTVGCKYVDEIIPYGTEQDLEDLLAGMHIDIRILGIEYRDKDFTGHDICKKRDIEIYFNERDHRFSSSGLRKHIADSFKKKK